jgi:hypothetical protein
VDGQYGSVPTNALSALSAALQAKRTLEVIFFPILGRCSPTLIVCLNVFAMTHFLELSPDETLSFNYSSAWHHHSFTLSQIEQDPQSHRVALSSGFMAQGLDWR